MLTIDASVIVAAGATDDPASTDAQRFLASVLASGLALHQPTLTVVEVTAAIARRTRDADLARAAGLHVLSLPGLILHELDAESAGAAAAMAGRSMLRAADAIYAATAARHDAVLVTLDDELLARSAPMVRAMTPGEWLEHGVGPSVAGSLRDKVGRSPADESWEMLRETAARTADPDRGR